MAISDTIQTSETDKLDRGRFREFLHNAFDMTDDILLDRIFKYFDSDNDGYIGKEEWIVGLSVFLKGKKGKEELLRLRCTHRWTRVVVEGGHPPLMAEISTPPWS